MSDGLSYLRATLPVLLVGLPAERPGGLLLSLLLGLGAAALGFLFALPVGAARAGRIPLCYWPATALVETVRGLPLVFLVLLVYILGRAPLAWDLSPRAAAAVALTLYATAYQADIVRSGLRSIPRQQVESAQASGLRPWQVLRWIELPQAVYRMVPVFAGHTVSIFKDTSVVMVLGVTELLTVARLRGALGTGRHFLLLTALVALLYLAAATIIGHVGRRVEARVATRARPL